MKVCENYKKLNVITEKYRCPIPFCDGVLEEVREQKLYSFADGYIRYHQEMIVHEDQLKTTFTSPWGTFCYVVTSFVLCNASAIILNLIYKILKLYLGHFIRIFIVDLFKLWVLGIIFREFGKKVERLNESKITLSA